MTKRIGLYSGTFDPVHMGHIEFAREAAAQARLETVIFYPERNQVAKPNAAKFEERFTTLRETLLQYPEFELAVPQDDSITVASTMRQFADLYESATVVLLFGSDVVPKLRRWVNPTELLSRHEFCIGVRGDATEDSVKIDILELEQELGASMDYRVTSTQFPGLSSTQLRLSTQPY